MAAGLPIDHPCHAARYVHKLIGAQAREQFVALYVSAAHCPIAYDTYTTGGINNVAADSGAILRAWVMSGAPFLITAHNHPSGQPMPSSADEEVWSQITMSARLLGLDTLDHMVLGEGEFYSAVLRVTHSYDCDPVDAAMQQQARAAAHMLRAQQIAARRP